MSHEELFRWFCELQDDTLLERIGYEIWRHLPSPECVAGMISEDA